MIFHAKIFSCKITIYENYCECVIYFHEGFLIIYRKVIIQIIKPKAQDSIV